MVVSSDNAALRQLLLAHPKVSRVEESNRYLFWAGKNGERSIKTTALSTDWYGLIETDDNNPLVCASSAGHPVGADALVLYGLKPLVQSNLTIGELSLISNRPFHQPSTVSQFLSGFESDVRVQDAGGSASNLIHLEIQASVGGLEPEDVDELFKSFYAVSFGVTTSTEPLPISDPRIQLNVNATRTGKDVLVGLRLTAKPEGFGGPLTTLQVFNVMNGFEDGLGVPTHLN